MTNQRRTWPVAVSSVAALLAGAALDARLGDPPNRLHPVAALGHAIRFAERYAPSQPRSRELYGLSVAASVPLVAALVSHLLARTLSRVPGTSVAVGAALLALTSSQRTLYERATEVANTLDRGDLDEARRLAATHLVSRDTANLDEPGIAAATIESVAENLSDGVVAPWCWFAIGGPPAAWAYRAANTLDAMWGYRRAPYAELGRPAAKLDDALNLVPARLTALAILAAGGGAGAATWWRDHDSTESPNAGHPMAAMAGVLGVALAKDGHYVLGRGGRAPGTSHIRRAITIARRAARLALIVVAVATAWRRIR